MTLNQLESVGMRVDVPSDVVAEVCSTNGGTVQSRWRSAFPVLEGS